jgi:hypothetical protein
MPIGVASMVGLTIANTGITRKTNAIAAISKLNGSPGNVRKPLEAIVKVGSWWRELVAFSATFCRVQQERLLTGFCLSSMKPDPPTRTATAPAFFKTTFRSAKRRND